MAEGPMAEATPTVRNGRVRQALIDGLADSGAVVIDSFIAVGGFAQFALRTLRWLFTRLPRRETLIPNFF